jgi:peptide/nickel transport system substrate-binding protein
VEGDQTVVRLRAGLRTAQGKALGGRDLAWSVTRARKMGAVGLLAPLGPFVRSDPAQPLLARFGAVDPGKLALLLTSPLTALLPVGFKPTEPDGTGAFRARCSAAALELSRNPNAARGPSFLERVRVRRAADLADSLRAFEGGQDDVGWLGLGFHRDRPKARRFHHGEVGWVVLVTGKEAGSYGAPGMAQQLANAVPVERLHLGLGRRAGVGAGASWGGGPASLLYDAGAAHLREVAEAVAANLSSPGHELTATPVSRSQLRSARGSGGFALAIDTVRRLDGGASPLLALATADKPELGTDVALRPPRLPAGRPAHQLTTTLRLGVLGSIEAEGGAIAEAVIPPHPFAGGPDLGGAYRGS